MLLNINIFNSVSVFTIGQSPVTTGGKKAIGPARKLGGRRKMGSGAAKLGRCGDAVRIKEENPGA